MCVSSLGGGLRADAYADDSNCVLNPQSCVSSWRQGSVWVDTGSSVVSNTAHLQGTSRWCGLAYAVIPLLTLDTCVWALTCRVVCTAAGQNVFWVFVRPRGDWPNHSSGAATTPISIDVSPTTVTAMPGAQLQSPITVSLRDAYVAWRLVA